MLFTTFSLVTPDDKFEERPTKTLESGSNSITLVAAASFVICGTLVNTISLDFNGILLNYTEYLSTTSGAASTITNHTASTITNHTIPLPNVISNFPMSGSVPGGDIIQHFTRPTIKTIHSLTNSLPSSFSSTNNTLYSIYQLVVPYKFQAITFIMTSFAWYVARFANNMFKGLNILIRNIFLCIKKFAGKIRNCMMNYGYSTTQGSGSYDNTGYEAGGGNKGNNANFSNTGGNSSGNGGGDDWNNNRKLPNSHIIEGIKYEKNKVLHVITQLLLQYQTEFSESIIRMENHLQILREIANNPEGHERTQIRHMVLSRSRLEYITEIIENYEWFLREEPQEFSDILIILFEDVRLSLQNLTRYNSSTNAIDDDGFLLSVLNNARITSDNIGEFIQMQQTLIIDTRNALMAIDLYLILYGGL
jgi:hypothetical protein